MSKKERNIEVIEEEREENGQTIVELKIGKQSLGVIKLNSRINRFQALLPNGSIYHTNTRVEAVNLLLRDYHLHQAN
ncbi:DUF2969 family protein [Liquorilactobacillus vini]|uniref:Uncharacterized protein n=1 Tax=Liquorilactobacillus vini DSM 20605 TaxID=1133569 RepID=A0A0R2CD99_9LACO|nr:DUF2969 family protein [Liquorilactobacillus vini]KRM86361.1 hypothetical protein FD21_GL001638 [Liquorilactobacillus vini DSM 20605]